MIIWLIDSESNIDSYIDLYNNWYNRIYTNSNKSRAQKQFHQWAYGQIKDYIKNVSASG